jgi:hypothetical protein
VRASDKEALAAEIEKLGGPRIVEEEQSDVDEWVKPMAAEAFHGIAGDFVRLIEPHTEADPAALLTNFLIAAGVLFGRHARCVADGKTHFPVDYLVMVGKSGESRKGTASTRTLNVINRVEENFSDEHVLSGLSSGEGLIKGMSNELQSPDLPGRYLGFLPEFGSLLEVMTRQGNTISAVLREAWDGDRLRVLTRNEPLDVSNVNLSIIAHVTPEELLNNLTATDRVNGFANRFLFVLVRRSKFLPEGGADVNVSGIVSRLHAAVSDAKGRGVIRRDEMAREFWAEAYRRLTTGRDGIRGALCSRAEAHTPRLSLLYALLDSADEIRLEHLRAALAVWDYSERCINWIFTAQSGDVEADRILRALASGPMSLSELHGVFGRTRTAEWLQAKLADIVRKGKIITMIKLANRKSVQAWSLR